MSKAEIDALRSAHLMFAGDSRFPASELGDVHNRRLVQLAAGLTGVGHNDRCQRAVHRSRETLLAAARTDAAAAGVLANAHRDQGQARALTGGVLAEAHADAAVIPATPMAQREAMRRRAARLRAQRAHVLWARARARRHLATLRALRYLAACQHRFGSGGPRLSAPNSRHGIAVRAALSRLGRPYAWGATGPDRFDCSGLVQWSYAQAGLHLHRTTYQQINDGVPVQRDQIRPGDLVFPRPGHVQIAIGNNLVVEAPHAGAPVRISALGNNVQIRRPV
ncbi:C40 family peptidase [Mycobacterium sp.]|uniref:C40 family peptidase n=1 Tax=Mycobacterium sp. TaxID=1785 RepID=UPI003BA89694